MNAETREARNWDFAWILDAVGADPTGHLPNCGLDIDTGIACACSKVGYRLSLALAQHDARLVAEAEQRGAERGWDEGYEFGVSWETGQRANPYRIDPGWAWCVQVDRADAQTPSKQGETDG